ARIDRYDGVVTGHRCRSGDRLIRSCLSTPVTSVDVNVAAIGKGRATVVNASIAKAPGRLPPGHGQRDRLCARVEQEQQRRQVPRVRVEQELHAPVTTLPRSAT